MTRGLPSLSSALPSLCATMDPARLQKLFSRIPQVDAAHVEGNLPAADKALITSILTFFITGGATPGAFARSVGKRTKVVRMNISEDKETAEVMLEVEVTPEMCNAFGTLHGACAAFLVDHATLGTFVLLGRVKGFDGVGMTTTMNLHWHTPATAVDSPSRDACAEAGHCVEGSLRWSRESRATRENQLTNTALVSVRHLRRRGVALSTVARGMAFCTVYPGKEETGSEWVAEGVGAGRKSHPRSSNDELPYTAPAPVLPETSHGPILGGSLRGWPMTMPRDALSSVGRRRGRGHDERHSEKEGSSCLAVRNLVYIYRSPNKGPCCALQENESSNDLRVSTPVPLLLSASTSASVGGMRMLVHQPERPLRLVWQSLWAYHPRLCCTRVASSFAHSRAGPGSIVAVSRLDEREHFHISDTLGLLRSTNYRFSVCLLVLSSSMPIPSAWRLQDDRKFPFSAIPHSRRSMPTLRRSPKPPLGNTLFDVSAADAVVGQHQLLMDSVIGSIPVLVRAAADGNDTTSSTSGSQYGYTPSEHIAIIFLVLFGLSTALHTAQALYFRIWWLLPTASPLLGTPFEIQISSIIIAPTPLLAASFIIFARVIRKMGSEYAVLPGRWYGLFFVPCDLIALVIQGVGGGIASAATTVEGANTGAKIMLGGIGFQFVVIVIFIALLADFVIRYRLDKPWRPTSASLEKSTTVSESESATTIAPSPSQSQGTHTRLTLILAALAFSSTTLFIRSVYRLIELNGGWTGRIIRTQVYFAVLDGGMVTLAMWTWNVVHPGVFLVDRVVFVEEKAENGKVDVVAESAPPTKRKCCSGAKRKCCSGC
uniref:RTA1-domain-containing protein n=1 Tax=Mycena chlorophos TaxID=658473 RepID=A0ABQ0LZ89_MYCCL|nr:predicted protein [Mycena chlorophos]